MPLYQTIADTKNETKVSRVIEDCTGWVLMKLPIRYGIDFMGMHGPLRKALYEVKCRTCESTTHEDYLLSAYKIESGLRRAEFFRIPFFLCVRWTDKIGLLHIESNHYRMEWGGRTDRQADQDIEPNFMLPINHFKEIG